MSAWRDIATAPKRGRKKILLGFAGMKFVLIGYWDPHWTWGPAWTDGLHAYSPTHWMPSPDPPDPPVST